MTATQDIFSFHRSVNKKIEEPVKRAFDKFATILLSEDRHLFFVAQKVNPNLTPEEVENIINKIYHAGIDIMIDYCANVCCSFS